MTPPEGDAPRLPEDGPADLRRADQDRTLVAVQHLEAALSSAAARREPAWRDEVCAALALLAEATQTEAENAERADSLLSDIARTQPHLRNRVRGLRLQYRQLREAITALWHELAEGPDDEVDYADVRQRLAWVLTALRHERARESDLIYEAYYDAFRVDLPDEAGGGRSPA